jgi:arylsulfatase A-like enzyme
VHEDVLPQLTSKVLEKIEAYREQPFFIYFPMPAPHTPILPSPAFVGKSGTNLYGDFVLMCDDVVGQIMRKLEELGLTDDTIIVYTSDNGCSPSADYPALLKLGHNPSYIFRGHKADIYEGGHRIPLLMKWPAGIPAGCVSHEPVCLVDLMATMADIVGVTLPDHAAEDSVSNLSVWTGDILDRPLREAIVHHSLNGSFSIRQGRWKLELCPGSGGWSDPLPGQEPEGSPSVQLYDLETDIGERVNVWDQHPEIVEQLKRLLQRYIEVGRSTPGTPQPNTGTIPSKNLTWLDLPATIQQ